MLSIATELSKRFPRVITGVASNGDGETYRCHTTPDNNFIADMANDEKYYPLFWYRYMTYIATLVREENKDALDDADRMPYLLFCLIPFYTLISAHNQLVYDVSEEYAGVSAKKIYAKEMVKTLLSGTAAFGINGGLCDDENQQDYYANGNFLVNQALIYEIYRIIASYSATLGVPFENLLASEKDALDLGAFPCVRNVLYTQFEDPCATVTLKNDEVKFQRLFQLRSSYEDIKKGNVKKAVENIVSKSQGASPVGEVFQSVLDNSYASTNIFDPRLDYYMSMQEIATREGYEPGDEIWMNYDSLIPLMNFCTIIIADLISQQVEMKKQIALLETSGTSAGGANNSQLNIKVNNLEKENKKLRQEIADLKASHANALKVKEQTSASERKRLKANYDSTYSELAEAKKELERLRYDLDQETLKRVLLEAEETELLEPSEKQVEPAEEETIQNENAVELIREYSKRKNIVVVGGTVYWKNRLHALYPDIEFYNLGNKQEAPTLFLKKTKHIDLIVSNTFNTSHILSDAVLAKQRTHGVPVAYMEYGQSVNRFNDAVLRFMATEGEV